MPSNLARLGGLSTDGSLEYADTLGNKDDTERGGGGVYGDRVPPTQGLVCWFILCFTRRVYIIVKILRHLTNTTVRTATSTLTCKYRELGEWSNTFNFVNICWELEASDILTLQHAFKLMESRPVYTSLVISLNQMWTHYSSRLEVLNWGWSWLPQGTLGKV